MFKWISLLALSFSVQAFANDGGIVQLDVSGIAPAANVSKTEVKLYGKDTQLLAQVLPVTDVSGGRSVHMVSNGWVTYIACQEEYVRPTTGLTRNDWMCTIGIEPRRDSIVDNGEIDKSMATPDMFFPLGGTGINSVLGVVPSPERGRVFSVYGENLFMLAQGLPSVMSFDSENYRVSWGCQPNYRSPSSGEVRSDFMCSLFVDRL